MAPVLLSARMRASSAAAAEKAQKHLQAIRDYSLSDKEPGTKFYYLMREYDDPLAFTWFVEYEDEEAMRAHWAGPVLYKFMLEVDDLVRGGLEGIEYTYHHHI